MLVREATYEDHDVVIELMQHLNPDDPVLTDSISRGMFAEILESKNFTIMVAVKSTTIVGTCYLNVIPNLTRGALPYAIIENVVTHPEFRRQGIGKALISHALNLAKSAGCYKVMLLTGGDISVQKFYEKCGMQSGSKTAFVKRWKIW